MEQIIAFLPFSLKFAICSLLGHPVLCTASLFKELKGKCSDFLTYCFIVLLYYNKALMHTQPSTILYYQACIL